MCLGYVQSCGHLSQLQTWDEVREMWVACQENDMHSVQESQGTTAIGQLAATLLHQSAKDFFLGQEATSIPFFSLGDTQKGHRAIIERLIALLEEHLLLDMELVTKPSEEAPLLSYAVEELAFHIRQLGENIGSLMQRNARFFGKSSKLRDCWWRYNHESWESIDSGFSKNVPFLHVACAENLYHAVKSFLQTSKALTRLKRRRDINTQWDYLKETPLHMAVGCKSARIVQLLLENGANIRITNKHEQSPLHYATDEFISFDRSIYKLLATSRTADKVFKNEAGHCRGSPTTKSLLHSAAAVGEYDICRELVEVWGYSIEKVDCWGWKPVDYALQHGHIHLFHHMVTHWSAGLRTHGDLFKAVMSLELSGWGSLAKSFKILIQNLGYKVNTTNADGSTIFHNKDFDYKFMQVVISLGLPVDWNKQNYEGQTIIHSNPTWLVDPRLLIIYLQESQFSINARDNWGRSPLHLYCANPRSISSHNRFDVRILLDFGADRLLEDKDDKTALDASISALDDEIARRHPGSEVLELLHETIKLLSNYSTVFIDPRKVDLNYDSGKWLDTIDWHSGYS